MIILICILVADFLSGLVHWAEDTYGLPTLPLIGKLVIEPNIEHHRNPTLMATMGTWLTRNLQPALLAISGSVLFWLIGFRTWPVFLIAVLAAFGNEVHAWNHRPKAECNWLINFLHDTGLVQSRKQHALHHKKPFDSYYCTLTNVTNAVLERCNFWRATEAVLLKMFGLTVKRMSEERDGW